MVFATAKANFILLKLRLAGEQRSNGTLLNSGGQTILPVSADPVEIGAGSQ